MQERAVCQGVSQRLLAFLHRHTRQARLRKATARRENGRAGEGMMREEPYLTDGVGVYASPKPTRRQEKIGGEGKRVTNLTAKDNKRRREE